MSNFAYLHVHTHFSRGGGPAAPVEWYRWAAEHGYGAIGFTDRSPLAGLPAMHRAARETGLRPIYGIEIDLLLPAGEGRKAGTVSQPALLLARGAQGMPDLARIASEAYSGWPGTEKAAAWDVMAANAAGLVLVLLGGDEAGVLTPCITTPTKKLASWASIAKAAFPQAIYAGIPHSGRSGDGVLADQVCSAAAALDLPVVAMPSARYLRAEEAPAYEALKAARRRAGWPRDDAAVTSTGSVAPDRPGHDYLRSPEEAAALFSRWPEAIENVERIVEMCGLDTERWPFKMEASPEGRAFLKDLAVKELQARLSAGTLPAAMAEQLDNALDKAGGRDGAWAALGRIVKMAQEGDTSTGPVPVGAPFGSASGSLLAYALGIAPLMPPGGQSEPANLPGNELAGLPGLEVPPVRREVLVAALANELGPGRLAHAAYALPIMATQAVQAAGMVLGMAGDPLKSLALATTVEGWDALSPDKEQDMGSRRLASLALAIKSAPLIFVPDPDTLLATPRQTQGTTNLASLGPILAGSIEWMPWTEEELSALNYPAFALRPTQPLAALDASLALARRYPVPGFQADEVDLQALPAPDENVIAILHKGELVGIPYLAPAAAKGWSGEATLDSAAQLAARSLHPKRPPVPDPKPEGWDEITAATGGSLLFRNQLTAVLTLLGISREAMAEMMRAMLLSAAEESEAGIVTFIEFTGLEADAARSLWNALREDVKLMVARDAAAAWGRTALWLAALKAAHPAALLAGALSAVTARADVARLAGEARRLGIKIEQPDINRSEARPLLQRDGDVWFILWGLNHLPGWQASLTARFLATRPAAGFASLREVALAAVGVGVSLSNLETLIRSGACDALGTLGASIRDRDTILEVLPAMLEWARATRSGAGQLDLFSAPTPEPPVEEDLQDFSHSEFTIPRSPRQRYLRKLWEEANVGVAFTRAAEMDGLVVALEKSGDLRSRLLTTAQIGEQHVGESISLVGILSAIQTVEGGEPGDGERLAYGRLEDTEGSIELVAFPPNYKRHAELWAESSQVIVTARVSRHDDGEIYLLSEHIAPFQVGASEEAMTLTIRARRQSKSDKEPATAPSEAPPVPARPTAPAAISASIQARPQPGPLRPQPAVPGEPATYSLIISLPPADDDHELIDSMIALNNLLNSHPGPDSVTIRVQYSPETGKWTSARLPGGVRFSAALEQSIRRLLGEDALAVIKLAA
jgi:DNA polymerase III alpha subunit